VLEGRDEHAVAEWPRVLLDAALHQVDELLLQVQNVLAGVHVTEIAAVDVLDVVGRVALGVVGLGFVVAVSDRILP